MLVIKLRAMRYIGMWHAWETEVHAGFWWGDLRERVNLVDPGIHWRTILKWIFKKCDRGHGPELSGSVTGKVAGSCKCGNEPSNSIKCGEFLD